MAKKRKQREQFTQKEMIMFGKMCECGACSFCFAYEQEKVWEGMVEEVKKASENAKQTQEDIKKGWLWK